MIKQLPAFPAARYYKEPTARTVKAQYTNGVDSDVDEAAPIVLEGGAYVDEDGAIVSGSDGIYSFDCPYFGLGDFTLEAKITFYSWGEAAGQPSYVFGQYDNGSLDVSTNSWNLRVHNGLLHWVERRGTTTTATPSTVTAERFAFQLNREYHVVAERVGGTVSLYVDGIFYVSLASTAPLTNSPAPIMSEQIGSSTSIIGYGRCPRRIRDIRVASRALYHGAIYKNFKKVRHVKRTLANVVSAGRTGPTVTPRGPVVQSGQTVNLTAANSWLELAHDAKYAVGEGDFRFEIIFTFKNNVTNTSEALLPFLSWRTWAAPGQPINMEIQWFGGYLTFQAGSSLINTQMSTPIVGQRYDLVIERSGGFISFHINGELTKTAEWRTPITVDVNRPLLIGQRYGGSNYSAYWTMLMDIEHCWFGIPGEEQS